MTGKYSNTALDAFIKSQRDRTIAYLQRNFSVSKDECEDIFQDSFIILYQNAQEGKLDNLTSSVSTYFMAICRNKTMELLRTKGKYIHAPVDDDTQKSTPFLESKINKVLSFDSDDASIEQKEALVRDIVKDLPSPCNELLWGFYRDGLSMKDLAERYGYSNENTVKVTKHRCCDKFKKRFTEVLHKLFLRLTIWKIIYNLF